MQSYIEVVSKLRPFSPYRSFAMIYPPHANSIFFFKCTLLYFLPYLVLTPCCQTEHMFCSERNKSKRHNDAPICHPILYMAVYLELIMGFKTHFGFRKFILIAMFFSSSQFLPYFNHLGALAFQN